MRRWWFVLVLLTIAAWPARADGLSLNDLVEEAKRLDGQTVTVQGEAVGDVMIRGEFGWVNISDGTNDIGIWAPAELLRRIGQVGRYHTKGDTVRVTGTFRRADPQQGGDLAITATEFAVVEAGAPVGRPVSPGRLWLALGALALGAGVWAIRFMANQRRRRATP